MLSQEEEQLTISTYSRKDSPFPKKNQQVCNSKKIITLIIFIVFSSIAIIASRLPKNTHTQQANTNPILRTEAPKQSQAALILSNPYNDDNHSFIGQQQMEQAKTWRNMLYHDPSIIDQLTNNERQYYNSKYRISQYPQLPFCIIVPTFNNKLKNRHSRNIKSIIGQDYSRFKFIIIDDASVDGTYKDLVSYLERVKLPNISYKIVANTQRKYSLANVRWAARSFCDAQQIMMVVDGDDELVGRQVLKLFNAVFQQQKIWIAYSNHLASNGSLGYSRPYHPKIIKDNSYRKFEFTMSHLRAYYTKLFLSIKDEDLEDTQGALFKAAGDMAACIPMLEQAHQKVAYIPEITYFYNINTGLNVHKDRVEEQRRNNLVIRSKRPYAPLTGLFP